MKNKVLLISFGVVLLGNLTQAQQSPTQQTRILNISQRVEKNKLKLSQLEKELEDKSNQKEKAVKQAVESANENRDAAVKLSDDVQHRKKAKRAEKRSDQAKRDAKKARRATRNAKELENDISQLKKQITKDEAALSKLNAQAAN